MWESRVLGEISKALWKPVCGFHGAVICIAMVGIVVLLRDLVGAQVGLDLGPPAPRAAFEHVRVMEQPIEERSDGGRVAEQLPPVVHRSVGRQECGRALVAAHDDLQEIFGRGVWQLPHAQIINNQEWHGREIGQIDLARAVEGRIGEFLEQRVGFAIDETR